MLIISENEFDLSKLWNKCGVDNTIVFYLAMLRDKMLDRNYLGSLVNLVHIWIESNLMGIMNN